MISTAYIRSIATKILVWTTPPRDLRRDDLSTCTFDERALSEVCLLIHRSRNPVRNLRLCLIQRLSLSRFLFLSQQISRIPSPRTIHSSTNPPTENIKAQASRPFNSLVSSEPLSFDFRSRLRLRLSPSLLEARSTCTSLSRRSSLHQRSSSRPLSRRRSRTTTTTTARTLVPVEVELELATRSTVLQTVASRSSKAIEACALLVGLGVFWKPICVFKSAVTTTIMRR